MIQTFVASITLFISRVDSSITSCCCQCIIF